MQFKSYLFFVILLLLSGCDSKHNDQETKTAQPIQVQNSFAFETLNNQSITITTSNKKPHIENNQKPILFHFFTLDSRSSEVQLQLINTLAKKFSSELLTISILLDDTIDTNTIQNYLKKNHITHTVVFSKQSSAFLDSLYSIRHLPQILLYSHQGELIEAIEGFITIEMLESNLTLYLES